MTEVNNGGERLLPADELTQLIDGHFDAVGGAGEPNRYDPHAESIKLEGADSDGLLGHAPSAVWAHRPTPGQEHLAKQSSPADSGHRVKTFAYQAVPQAGARAGQFSWDTTYFLDNNKVWARFRFKETVMVGRDIATRDSEENTRELDMRETAGFLDWLRRAAPVLPGTSEEE